MTNYGPSPQEAARELIQRREARAKLLPFTSYTYPGYHAEPAHGLIAQTLDQVVTGKIQRLMIFAPPQHGKSELTSVRLPAFWLGRRPDDPVIIASYGADLAEDKSRQVREIVSSEDYANVFGGIELQPDSRAVNRWKLAGHRGGLLAVGVGGPITGRGALLGIIDDPVKDWEEAQSETFRERTWAWYRNTFRTRIWEGGAIVLIMTRWHEDDLAGRLLAQDPKAWTILRLPAVAETQEERDHHAAKLGAPAGEPDPLGRAGGEPLCPGRFSAAALGELCRDVGPQGWHAQYQGVPRPAEGSMFKRAWFPIVEAVPYAAMRVRYWDKAGTEGAGCRSAGALVTYCPGDDTWYIEDMIKGQWSAGQREEVILSTARADAKRYGHVRTYVEQEPGSGGKESAEHTVNKLAGYPVFVDAVTGSKVVRAAPLAAQAESGHVRLVRGAWNEEFIEELASFPRGRFKDQVDAAAGGFNKVTLGWEEEVVVVEDHHQEISRF